MVRRVVQESLIRTDPNRSAISPSAPVLAPGGVDLGTPGPSRRSPSLSGSSESEADLKDPGAGFDFSLVPRLVKAVKDALRWEEPVEAPSKQRKYFKHLKKDQPNFPFLEELGEIISEEWSKVERKNSLISKVAKMYPFKNEEVKHLESAPLIDAALMRLVRHVTLPLEDTVSFKDGLERKIDTDLKRIYITAGMACKPALALAALSKAMESWSDDVDAALASVSEDLVKSSPIHELKLASVFLGEASLDIIRLVARVMLSSVTAKRALWLRPWVADPASKQAWCRIPFEGSSLFGNKLDSAISRATGGRSGFLPQDRRLLGQRRPQPRQDQERARDARRYRPGRDFRRNWKRNQPSGQKSSKTSSSGGREASKSF